MSWMLDAFRRYVPPPGGHRRIHFNNIGRCLCECPECWSEAKHCICSSCTAVHGYAPTDGEEEPRE